LAFPQNPPYFPRRFFWDAMKNENTLFRFGVVVVLLGGLTATACGGPSTKFVSSWRSPKAEPIHFRGEPVAAVIMVDNEIKRRQAEDVLAREITYYGAKGIPMYRITGADPETDEAKAKAAIERSGVKGVVVMRPKGKRTTTETHEYYNAPMYAGYWGGYYGYGWGQPWSYARYGLPTAGPEPFGAYGTAYSTPGTTTKETTTTEVVVVEVLVFSLKQNLLVWAGESESTPPEKVDEFVTQLAAETSKELGEKGLLSSK
ncbi:MAG TPA: hypothetical protein VHM25_21100, partial [Polyangiaceae bacterium]|nr:hypothetical protein [Polyangiaceae bacterium]